MAEIEELIKLLAENFKLLIKEAVLEEFAIITKEQKSNSSESQIFSVEEVAKYLKIKKPTVYAMSSYKQIPHFKMGKRLLFKKNEIDKWIETGRVLTNTELEALAEKITKPRRYRY